MANFHKELRALRRAVRFGEPDGGYGLPEGKGLLRQVRCGCVLQLYFSCTAPTQGRKSP